MVDEVDEDGGVVYIGGVEGIEGVSGVDVGEI